jgi:phosphomannomutase/phosphoglucomutase
MQLFGTAGVRGITNKDITPEIALKISTAYGSIFKGNIAVARDTRYGAEMIEHAVISGLQSTGNKVHRLGIIPLPIFARYVADFMDGGIMVTGSHTPPQIMGIIAVDSMGRDIPRSMAEKIEKKINERINFVEWDKIEDTTYEDAVEHYLKFIGKEAKGLEGFKILVDPANGAGAGIINRIFESLGIETHCINCERKHIPNRPSEPRRETVEELRRLSTKFDIGIGTDVDADRVLFASSGKVYSEDVIGAIFAREYAKEKMVTPINSSSLIEKVAKEYGFEVIYCPVGPPEIAEYILKCKADYGYEETGKYIFPPDTLWGDAILSTLKLLHIMNSRGATLEKLAKEFPEYHQIKEKIPVRREMKRSIVEKIGDYLERNLPDSAKNIVRVDGVKIIYEDSWLLIRASGTEDVIRVFSDAPSEKKARELVEYGKNIVRKFIENQQG